MMVLSVVVGVVRCGERRERESGVCVRGGGGGGGTKDSFCHCRCYNSH